MIFPVHFAKKTRIKTATWLPTVPQEVALRVPALFPSNKSCVCIVGRETRRAWLRACGASELAAQDFYWEEITH
jgi:hypothetical protein